MRSSGPFRLVSRIARGGMAETFVGERTGLAGFAQRVCVKRILAEDQGDPKWIRLFQKAFEMFIVCCCRFRESVYVRFVPLALRGESYRRQSGIGSIRSAGVTRECAGVR